MEYTIQNEERNWVSAVGKAFEFIKVILDAVLFRGGNSSHLSKVLSNNDLGSQIADVLMGAAKIVPIKPYKIITETGESEVIKVLAVQNLDSDAERIRLIDYDHSEEFMEALLSGLKNRGLLYRWFNKIPKDSATQWVNHESGLQNLQKIFSYMNDDHLFKIVCRRGFRWHMAMMAIKNQNLLKSFVKKGPDEDFAITAIRAIDDEEFIFNLIEEYHKDAPGHRNERMLHVLRMREEELLQEAKLRKAN